jgi:hypothetical protein
MATVQDVSEKDLAAIFSACDFEERYSLLAVVNSGDLHTLSPVG